MVRSIRRYLVLLAVAALAAGTAGPASAQFAPDDTPILLDPVASGLTAPLLVTHAGDGSGRRFIVDQTGVILIVDGSGALLPTPFLDVSAKLPPLNPGFDERGLLGLAFHPDYETNGRFFVRYSVPRDGDASEPCFGTSRGCHSEVLAEYLVSGDPNVADPLSEMLLFTVEEPQFNHNAGDVAFGPDGYLYFTLGDGGGGNDGLADVPPSHGPIGNGQNIETALGSILRIDVDGAGRGVLPYAIPPDNPFVGVPGVDEIYAYGMRNPYRFSFDDGPGGSGALFLADVGQALFEEVNIVENGGNYGWVIREGFHCFDPFASGTPPDSCPGVGPLGEPLLDPIAEYAHPGSGFLPEGGITVVGGYVYRGLVSPNLTGKYVFGDFAQGFTDPSGRLYSLVETAPDTWEIRQFVITNRPEYGLFLKGFGEDEDGEVYVCGSTALAPTGTTGVVERITEQPPVAIDYFRAARLRDKVVVSWRMTPGTGFAGYHLHRESAGARERLTDLPLTGSATYEFHDDDPRSGASDYWLEETDSRGDSAWYGPASVPALAPAVAPVAGFVAQPNPFRAETMLSFSLGRQAQVRLDVFDARGRRLATLVDGAMPAGRQTVAWDGRSSDGARAATGIYFARLQAEGVSRTQKIVLTQ